MRIRWLKFNGLVFVTLRVFMYPIDSGGDTVYISCCIIWKNLIKKVTLVVLGFIFLPKPLQKIYYQNQATKYDFTYTELTFTKTGFTENDIHAASEAVKNFFEVHFYDRRLLRLAYDEEETTDENKTVYNPNHADAIVFIGDYYLFEDPVAGDSSRLRTNWKWFVKKDSNGEWEVIDQGYC